MIQGWEMVQTRTGNKPDRWTNKKCRQNDKEKTNDKWQKTDKVETYKNGKQIWDDTDTNEKGTQAKNWNEDVLHEDPKQARYRYLNLLLHVITCKTKKHLRRYCNISLQFYHMHLKILAHIISVLHCFWCYLQVWLHKRALLKLLLNARALCSRLAEQVNHAMVHDAVYIRLSFVTDVNLNKFLRTQICFCT